jgi:DNA polymerase-3 subunit delta
VHVQELLHKVDPSSLPPVLFFCPGKANERARDATFEPMLAEQAVERVANACVDPSMRDMAYTVFYADETDAGQIVMEAQTFPFLSERRVVVVRNAELYFSPRFEKRAAALIRYLNEPADTTLLMMVASKADKRMAFFKACQKAGAIVECPEFTEQEVGAWVRETAAARGKQLDAPAMRALIARVGTHLSDVRNALSVVMGYVGDQDTIRAQDVNAACADVAEEEIWTLTDAIAASDVPKALEALRRLLDLGKFPDEIIGTINWLLKSAYTVAVPECGQKLKPFVANKVAPLANKLGREKLRDAFALCTDAQFMMRNTGVNATLALELLVVKLAAPRRSARPAARA